MPAGVAALFRSARRNLACNSRIQIGLPRSPASGISIPSFWLASDYVGTSVPCRIAEMTARSRRLLFAVVAVSVWGTSSLAVFVIASGLWTAYWTLGAGLVMVFVDSLLFPISINSKDWERRLERIRRGQCPECAYDLTGNVSGTCPECGAAVRD